MIYVGNEEEEIKFIYVESKYIYIHTRGTSFKKIRVERYKKENQRNKNYRRPGML